MPIPETEQQPGVGKATKNVAEHASALVRLELELAALELKRKLISFALGIGLVLGALLFLLYALGFGLAAAAAGGGGGGRGRPRRHRRDRGDDAPDLRPGPRGRRESPPRPLLLRRPRLVGQLASPSAAAP